MYNIRAYKKSDFPVISRWWSEQNEVGPTELMMPEESSFIVESEFAEPIAAVTIYMTNSKQFCLVDNLVGNPTFYGQYRKDAIAHLQSYLEKWASSKGYLSLMCMAYKPQLTKRYEDLGYMQTLSGVTTMIKNIQESV
jgi:hypothetical protein